MEQARISMMTERIQIDGEKRRRLINTELQSDNSDVANNTIEILQRNQGESAINSQEFSELHGTEKKTNGRWGN